MEKEYVGIDLHRRRSVIYRMDRAGEKIDSVRVRSGYGPGRQRTESVRQGGKHHGDFHRQSVDLDFLWWR